jgi:hypothetical protein
MKITTIVISFACLSQVALADDLATPTPTPAIYHGRSGRVTAVRRQEQLERRNRSEPAAEARAQQRAKKSADRGAVQNGQAQAREAARAREQAQREVAAQNRRESHDEKPHLTSDLMSRMGFSEQQVAEQKAREQSANAESKKTTESSSPGQ